MLVDAKHRNRDPRPSEGLKGIRAPDRVDLLARDDAARLSIDDVVAPLVLRRYSQKRGLALAGRADVLEEIPAKLAELVACNAPNVQKLNAAKWDKFDRLSRVS